MAALLPPSPVPELHRAVTDPQGAVVVEQLLAGGADPDVLDDLGRTPLLRWADDPSHDVRILHALLSHGPHRRAAVLSRARPFVPPMELLVHWIVQ